MRDCARPGVKEENDKTMNTKTVQRITITFATLALVAVAIAAWAGDAKSDAATAKPKPYPLKTCVVSGEKLDGDMGKPYVFTHEGREIKLCCKSCLKDFKKDPAKYLKKLDETKKPAAEKGHDGHHH